MIFFVKPSIGKSAALKTWQCASMMRLIRGADCAQADGESTDFSAATAILPAINSRRRIAHLVHVGPRSGKKALMNQESICVFLEYWFDAVPPGTVEFLQELFGRRNPARDVLLKRTQIRPFVFAAGVQPAAPREPLLRQRNRHLRQVQDFVTRDRGAKA